MRRGSRFSAELLNGLDADTTIHWHGLGVPVEMDGHPTRHVSPGRAYRYEFSVDDAASTYWYHPHAHRGTALQTYRGLAALFLVEDGATTGTALVVNAKRQQDTAEGAAAVHMG